MTVYAYCRVSTSQQVEGESLAVQERQLQGWAMMHDREIGEVFVEEGVSGSIPIKDRPQGAAMFAKLKKDDTIVAVKLDRMFRSALDALQVVEDLADRRINLVLLDIGEVTNGLSKLFLTISAAFAEAERDRIRERIVGSKRDGKARGRYLGGIVPFGFRKGSEGALEPVEEEQVVITVMRALRASGKPLRAIQAHVLEHHGRKLSLDAVSRIVGY